MVLRTREWYEEVYPICEAQGCLRLNNAKEVQNITQCVLCWQEKILNDKVVEKFTGDTNVTTRNVRKCVNDYIYAFLSQSQPTLNALSRHKYQIDVPESRPANYWWSVTVDLPCKPKHFVFFNAYCINSFGTGLSEREYVLVQNSLVRTNSGMTFFVDFTKNCTFEAKDIKIIWSESSPTPGLPQTGPLSSSFVPTRRAPLNIYFDVEAAERLTHVGGGFVDEYETALAKDQRKRAKRQVGAPRYQIVVKNRLSKLGLVFPCVIGSLQIPNGVPQKNQPYRIIGSTGKKYLIDLTAFKSRMGQTSKFQFNLNFGNSGCHFDAGEVLTLPNPPPDWLGEQLTGLECITCHNARSDKDCVKRGVNTICMENEICQTEVRYITKRHKLITKSCKNRNVCRINSEMKKTTTECKPGRAGSACICCCNSHLCNDTSSHCGM